MVQLLTAAGYTASYVTGSILLSASQWSNWLNVGTSDIALAVGLLGNGGFPGYFNVTANTISIDYCWVQVVIGGATYQFDPALKSYTSVSGMNLASAMGYNRASFVSGAETGATITADYVQAINESGNSTSIDALLTDYAMSLVNHIKTTNSGAGFNDVLGGRTINPVTSPVRNSTLPYIDSSQPAPLVSSSLDPSLKATLRVRLKNAAGAFTAIDHTFNAADIYGQRMSLLVESGQQYLRAVSQWNYL